jgi:N-methylhydantoinase A
VIPPRGRTTLSTVPGERPPPSGSRDVYDPTSGRFVATALFDRPGLEPGMTIDGPAIIAEQQTTTVIASHHRCTVQPDLALLIERRPESVRNGRAS